MIRIIDFLHNFIWSLKLPFLEPFLSNFSTLCLHRLSKFVKKLPQKSSIFLTKASYARSLMTCLLLLTCHALPCYNLLFIHLGKELPSYIEDAIAQAELFNPDAHIYLLANVTAAAPLMKKYENRSLHVFPLETIHKSKAHRQFCEFIKERKNSAYKSMEKLFYLSDFMNKLNLTSTFYVENDVMLYTDLGKMLPLFESLYHNIAATFDNDNRCTSGFLFFKNSKSADHLVKFIAKHASPMLDDRQMMATYLDTYGREHIDFLPITTANYDKEFPMISEDGHKTTNKKAYSNFVTLFESIFDAAVLGEFMSAKGVSNIPSESTSSMQESCLINPRHFSYSFEEDSHKRVVPYISCRGEKYRINNLQIRSKDLKKFSSKSKELLSKPPIS